MPACSWMPGKPGGRGCCPGYGDAGGSGYAAAQGGIAPLPQPYRGGAAVGEGGLARRFDPRPPRCSVPLHVGSGSPSHASRCCGRAASPLRSGFAAPHRFAAGRLRRPGAGAPLRLGGCPAQRHLRCRRVGLRPLAADSTIRNAPPSAFQRRLAAGHQGLRRRHGNLRRSHGDLRRRHGDLRRDPGICGATHRGLGSEPPKHGRFPRICGATHRGLGSEPQKHGRFPRICGANRGIPGACGEKQRRKKATPRKSLIPLADPHDICSGPPHACRSHNRTHGPDPISPRNPASPATVDRLCDDGQKRLERRCNVRRSASKRLPFDRQDPPDIQSSLPRHASSHRVKRRYPLLCSAFTCT
jgi:hypothetical protein